MIYCTVCLNKFRDKLYECLTCIGKSLPQNNDFASCDNCYFYYGYDCEGCHYCRANEKITNIQGYDYGINCKKFKDVNKAS